MKKHVIMPLPDHRMVEDYCNFLSSKLGYAPLTIKNQRWRLQAFLKWLESEKLELLASSCEKYIVYKKSLGQSPTTINMYIDLFWCLDQYFKDRGEPIVLSSGFKRIKREQGHIELLTPSEIEMLTTTPLVHKKQRDEWKESDRVYLLLTTFLAYSGCRYGEARDLLKENVDQSTGRVLIPTSKNGQFRYVFLPPSIIARMKPLLRGDPKSRVFTTNRGNIIYASSFLLNLRKRAKLCKINKRIYPHLFRHSMATQLIVDGVPIEQVATILGHKEISTTYKNYIHLADQQIRKAMYRHTLFKKASPPNEVIQGLVEAFKSFKLDTDTRFIYQLEEGVGKLNLQLFVK